MEYTFRQSIWAVGQGGFSMGTLYGGDTELQRLYTYVYDCGTDQLAALRRELESANTHFPCGEEKKIDTVFLSHLDADHVNGFDIMCEAVHRQIDCVVLPYMDRESGYYLAAKAMEDGSASGLFLEFTVDPVKWIRARLPEAEIVLLGPSPEGGDVFRPPEIPSPAPDEFDERDSSIRKVSPWKLKLDMDIVPAGDTDYRGISQHRWASIQAKAEGMLHAPIMLLAYVPPRSDRKLQAFRDALSAAGFGKLSGAGLKKILADSALREKLRECYSSLASDHNILSMNLLVKSLFPVARSFKTPARMRHGAFGHKRMGFLFTGDAKLSVEKYFSRWREFYRGHLDDVVIFSLPHHGARSSFSPRLLSALPNAAFITQSGPNGYGHPSDDVVAEVRAAGREYHQVDEEVHNRIDVSYLLG